MQSLHLLYHELRPDKSRYTYVTTCDEFATHCALFARLQAASGEDRMRPEITFDDGHVSDFRQARPVLDRFGLRATFFITAGWTATRAGYMDWAQLRTLRAEGHRIGAHGMTHQLLTACSAVELDRELRGARAKLEDGLGAPVRSLSLPGGRANGRVLRACRETGYTEVFTSEPRAEVMDLHPETVGRLNLVGRHDHGVA
jgi:peptidoglycan/xylan/chitin deacetylase (PgdA/CDA1 family)